MHNLDSLSLPIHQTRHYDSLRKLGFLLYHQANASVLALEVWDSSSQTWTSVNISIATTYRYSGEVGTEPERISQLNKVQFAYNHVAITIDKISVIGRALGMAAVTHRVEHALHAVGATVLVLLEYCALTADSLGVKELATIYMVAPELSSMRLEVEFQQVQQ